ncbi:MAG: helix-turn-helix domain-containing protein [Nitrospirae bacterium]|nr:helix-turn-helix domain-containing protein [Nitrospirota bacterium]
MINIEFTEDEKKKLNMEVLWLKSQGFSHKDIARAADICENTMRSYFDEYIEGGIEKLKRLNFYKPQSEMEKYRESIEAYFKDNPPSSIKEAMGKIEELTGIKRSETQVRKFIKSIGMKRFKVDIIPSKADFDKQEDLKKKQLEPILEEARNGKRAVFFVDAAHFVLAPFIGYLWSVLRTFIKAPSGRQRFNVLAALNAITHEIITVTNDTYINAESVCNLLRKISILFKKHGRGVAEKIIVDK